MICQNCGYDDNGTGDFAHACKPLNLSDPAVQKRLAAQWGYVQKPHPDCDEGCMFQCAQPAPSVPEDVMRDAERYRYLRARDDGTAGVGCWIEADGRVCDRGWLYGVQLDSAIDSFIEVLAAAPKPEAKS